MKILYEKAVKLLQELIALPSFSTEEKDVADHVEIFLKEHAIQTIRKYNNIWCYNEYFQAGKPLLLLNSHLDTVRPNSQYRMDPFLPVIREGKLYGLGSNDAGGALVSLICTFLHFNERRDLPFNICLAVTAEEEDSGLHGIRSILNDLMPVSFAIVGEPTGMHMATSERGSMVLDCVSMGKAGHAAREEGDNAIYRAIRDIHWFSSFEFPTDPGQQKAVKMSVTEINAGLQHNIIPGECSFTVDIRFDHSYTVKEIINVIKNHTFCDTSLRPNVLYPSAINESHLLVQAAQRLGRETYISPTSSDQGWLKLPSVKMGPGDSARSHSADEYIYLSEIEEGISIYISLLDRICSMMVSDAQLKSLSFEHQLEH